MCLVILARVIETAHQMLIPLCSSHLSLLLEMGHSRNNTGRLSSIY